MLYRARPSSRFGNEMLRRYRKRASMTIDGVHGKCRAAASQLRSISATSLQFCSSCMGSFSPPSCVNTLHAFPCDESSSSSSFSFFWPTRFKLGEESSRRSGGSVLLLGVGVLLHFLWCLTSISSFWPSVIRAPDNLCC